MSRIYSSRITLDTPTGNWHESELVLALDFYIREPRCKRSNRELGELAARMGRSTGSLYARLQNYKAVDPEYVGAGLSAGVGVCKPIWDRYADRLRRGEDVDMILRELVKREHVTWYDNVRTLVLERWATGQTFSLNDAYDFEETLGSYFPGNAHVKEKIRQTLQKLRDAGEIESLDKRGFYKVKLAPDGKLYPDEVEPGPVRVEGSVTRIEVNAYERNAAARMDCIRHHGCRCFVCGMSFLERYGTIGEGFIHVHHLKPLASVAKEYVIDPVLDLAPVCPNCHAMLHRQNPPITIEELRAKLM